MFFGVTSHFRCADCGFSVTIHRSDGRYGGTCFRCGSPNTKETLLKRGLLSDPVPDLPKPPDHSSKNNLPERHRSTQVCQKCKCEFVPTPNHVGFINLCPECFAHPTD
jgi:hypothetical protein